MSDEMKIYTRTGDQGQTSLIGGTRVPKYDERIEAYGTVDEFNSFVGLIRDHEHCDSESREFLIEIQNRLFTIESHLATDKNVLIAKKIPELNNTDINRIESEIDRMTDHLEPLSNFILPGGHTLVSLCHVARTVCRRSERLCLKVATDYPIDPIDLKYLNRLSDYFFVLARYFSHLTNSSEIKWNSL
jgi:cob(I)alamin adenosyltransferase